MPGWKVLGAALLVVTGAGLTSVGSQASALGSRASPASRTPGFAVVPDMSEPAIQFEPFGDRAIPMPRMALPRRAAAAAPKPLAPDASRAQPVAAAKVAPTVPPPLAVLVTFPRKRTGARMQADQVATALRAQGMPVQEAETDRPAGGRGRILFAFSEDRAAATAIGRALQAATGLDSPTARSPMSANAARPGAIEVALPG